MSKWSEQQFAASSPVPEGSGDSIRAGTWEIGDSRSESADRSLGETMSTDRTDLPDSICGIAAGDRVVSSLADLKERLTPKPHRTDVGTHGSSAASALHSPRPGSLPPSASELLTALRAELAGCSESLQAHFDQSLNSLVETQKSAASSQNDAVRTLTNVVVSNSGANAVSAGEVESLLSDLHDRLAETVLAAFRATLRGEAEGVSAPARQQDLPALTPTPAAAPPVPKSESPSGSSRAQTWEEIRREFLNGSGDAGSSTTERVASALASSEASTGTSSPSPREAVAPKQAPRNTPPEEPELALEIPEFLDTKNMTEAELRDTLHSREKLLSMMIGRLRRHNQHHGEYLTTEQLRELSVDSPPELAARINHALQRLDEQIRLGELELSLERARVARQAAQLDRSRQQIERSAVQLGWTLNEDGTLSQNTSAAGKSNPPRRWLGKLGFSE